MIEKKTKANNYKKFKFEFICETPLGKRKIIVIHNNRHWALEIAVKRIKRIYKRKHNIELLNPKLTLVETRTGKHTIDTWFY